MRRSEFEGRTAAEAAIKACDAFGVSRSQLQYEVVSDEGEGLERVVRIVAQAEEGAAAPSDDFDERRASEDEDRGRERNGRRGRSERGDRGDRGGRRRGRRGGDRDRDRGGRRDRNGSRRTRGPRDEGDGIEALLDLEIVPSERQPERPTLEGTGSERAQRASAVLAEIVRLSGLGVQPVLVQDDAEEIHFDLRGDDEAYVIGKKGETLLSLQFLVNRILSRDVEGEPVVVLDAANYRTRRRDALANLAQRLAERAIEEGKAVRLSPMSAHDRRVFHLTLKEMEEVETRSEGEGLYRHLLIIPSEYT